MSVRTSLLAFTGVAALSALAFAPLVSPTEPADAKASARAAVAEAGTGLGSTRLPGLDCVAEAAGPFACNNVDLVDQIPTELFGGGHGSDSWGWTADDGTEIAIVTSGNGVGFFRLEDDDSTSYLGTLALSTIQPTGILWHDVKVVNDHAYITAEDSGYGVQIVDMTKFVDAPEVPLDGVSEDVEQDGFLAGVQGHNMVGFPELGLIGVVLGEEEECGGHLVLYDVNGDATNPVKIGCAGPDAGPGVIGTPHDAQCVEYSGPDADYNGAGPDGQLGTEDDTDASDVCALFNQRNGGVVLMDITPITSGQSDRATFINRFDYDDLAYAHQGWFSGDQRWLFFGDELDESGALGSRANLNTATYYIDLTDLDVDSGDALFAAAPGYNSSLVKEWNNPSTLAIDHNMYPVGDLLFQANYGAGMRVLRFSDESLEEGGEGAFEEVAYFDTYPGPGPAEFYGAWNVYPFFESGKIIVSDFEAGLLVLRLHDEVTDPAA